MSNISNLSISEGKSGSFFFFSNDNKFIIKTISNNELNYLINDFLTNYYELIIDGTSSLLARTYGVYTLNVGLSTITIILMENVGIHSFNLQLHKHGIQ